MKLNNLDEITFLVKKTSELDKEEIDQINNLYNKVFENYINNLRNYEDFLKKFKSNEKMYSFHGLMKINNEIIGSYPVIPNKFNYFGKELFFGLVVDTLIDEKYRGNLDNLIKLNNIVYEKLKKENIPFVYGIANKNYYPIIKKILNYKDISYLNYYIKPINLIRKNFIITSLNFFLYSFGLIRNFFFFSQSKKNIIKKIYQDNFNTNINLYINFHNLKIEDLKDIRYAYKIKNEIRFNEKLRILYIFDISPMNTKTIFETINHIKKNHKDLDFVIFVKNGKEKSLSLFKLPKFFMRNTAIVSGKILDKTLIQNEIFEDKNWNFNLSNFDIK
jgi:hypothetical protein